MYYKLIVFFLLFCSVSFVFSEVVGEVLYIATDKAAIYQRPSTTSEMVIELGILEEVYYLYSTNISSRCWVYVDTGKSKRYRAGVDPIEGWIEGNNICRKKDFLPANRLPEMLLILPFIEGEADVYLIDAYYILSNGNFFKLLSSGPPFFEKGQVHFYRDILMFPSQRGPRLFVFREGKMYEKNFFEVTVLTNRVEFPLWARDDLDTQGFPKMRVIGDKVNVRVNPSTNAFVVTCLRKGEKVRFIDILKELPEQRIGGKRGRWCYVETFHEDERGRLIRGWIFDAYLKKE